MAQLGTPEANCKVALSLWCNYATWQHPIGYNILENELRKVFWAYLPTILP